MMVDIFFITVRKGMITLRKLQIADIDRAAKSLADFIRKNKTLTIITEDRKGFFEFTLDKNKTNVNVTKMKSGRIISNIRCTVNNCNVYIAQLLDDEECKYAIFKENEIICSKKLER